MNQEDHLNWQNDNHCVRVAELVINWMEADNLGGMTIDDLRRDLKDITLWDFLDDILVTVLDDRYEADAQALRARIGH